MRAFSPPLAAEVLLTAKEAFTAAASATVGELGNVATSSETPDIDSDEIL